MFNEEEVLSELFNRLSKSAEKWKYSWEVICIDDGSRDATYQLVKEKNKQDKRWKILSLSRNFGHQTALTCGLFYASGDAVIVLDADLQDPPEELYKLLKQWEKGFDVVFAIRKKRKEGIFKKISYFMFYRVLEKLANISIPLDSGDFCLMDKKVVTVLNNMPERNRFIRGLRAWSGFKQTGIEYERHARFAGESKYPLSKLIKLAMDGILSFSSVPLTIASYLGLWISFFAFLGIVFTLLQRVFASFFVSIGIGPVPGYATTVIIVLFLGGVQLIFLGVLGYYLSRIYDEVKGRPQWIIKNSIGIKGAKLK